MLLFVVFSPLLSANELLFLKKKVASSLSFIFCAVCRAIGEERPTVFGRRFNPHPPINENRRGNALAFPQASAQRRGPSGPRGYAARQDVLAAQDMETVPEEEDFEARLAQGKAKRATRGSGEPGKRAKREGEDKGAVKRGTDEESH